MGNQESELNRSTDAAFFDSLNALLSVRGEKNTQMIPLK